MNLLQSTPKDLTWNEDFKTLGNQYKVTAEQYHRIKRLKDKVGYVITDSPILQGVVYADYHVHEHIQDLFDEFSNVNYLLRRVKPYQKVGRNQTEDAAIALDSDLRETVYWQDHTELDGDFEAVNKIAYDVLDELGKELIYGLCEA